MQEVGKERSGRRSRRERDRKKTVYEGMEGASAGFIIFLVLATPWFFGTTEDWAVWTMNGVCFALGAVLLAKVGLRRWTGCKVERWGEETRTGMWLRRIFFGLNVAVLLFCLVAAVNARATFYLEEQRFEYHEDYVKWLPFSYDSRMTWFVFWQYLGLFCFFWALRDWLLGKTKRERRRRESGENELAHSAPKLPQRMRWLLWIVCLNGMALAVEGILQRLDGTPKLLWLRDSWWKDPTSSFGPYSYRGNAAEYLNLIWPVSIGFWWLLAQMRETGRGKLRGLGDGPHLILLPASIAMGASPMISASRGGAIVAFGNLLSVVVLLLVLGRARWITRAGVIALALGIAGSGLFLGWEKLAPRLEKLGKDDLGGRGEIYENAKEIAKDFTLFGTGPGTFRSVYQLYRQSTQQPWHAFLHDDWLETRVTFGRAGVAIVAANLLVLLSAPFLSRGTGAPAVLIGTIVIAVAGCLMHARFDFPMQTYSVLFMFVLLDAVMFCLCGRRRAGCEERNGG